MQMRIEIAPSSDESTLRLSEQFEHTSTVQTRQKYRRRSGLKFLPQSEHFFPARGSGVAAGSMLLFVVVVHWCCVVLRLDENRPECELLLLLELLWCEWCGCGGSESERSLAVVVVVERKILPADLEMLLAIGTVESRKK